MRAPNEGLCVKEIWPTPRDDQAPTLGETGDEPAGDARVRYYDMTKRYEVTPASAIKFARPHKKTAKVTGFAQSVVPWRLTLAQQAVWKSPPGVQEPALDIPGSTGRRCGAMQSPPPVSGLRRADTSPCAWGAKARAADLRNFDARRDHARGNRRPRAQLARR